MYESKSVGNASLIYSCHFIFFTGLCLGNNFQRGKVHAVKLLYSAYCVLK